MNTTMFPVTGLHHMNSDQYSFISDTASSESSTGTETTSSTIWGPGALAGKGLLAVGKTILRTAENAVIYQRLRSIKSYLSGTNSSISPKSEQIYFDLIELCRPNLYTLRIRRQALSMLLMQIATFKATRIVQALANLKWHTNEISLFLFEIRRCMPTTWSGLNGTFRQPMHVKLEKVYMYSQTPGTHFRFDPLAVFIGEVATIGETGCAALADSGFIDMLMSMFLNNSPPIQTFHRQLEPGSSNINLFCVSEYGCVGLLETITVPINARSDEAYCQLIETRYLWKYGQSHWVLTSPLTSHGAALVINHGASMSFQFAIRARGGPMSMRHLWIGEDHFDVRGPILNSGERKLFKKVFYEAAYDQEGIMKALDNHPRKRRFSTVSRNTMAHASVSPPLPRLRRSKSLPSFPNTSCLQPSPATRSCDGNSHSMGPRLEEHGRGLMVAVSISHTGINTAILGASFALELIESMITTKNMLMDLAHHCRRIVVTITEKLRIGEIPDAVRRNVEDLIDELRQVHTVAMKVILQRHIHRLMRQPAHKQTVATCHERMRDACRLFKIRSSISICEAVTQVGVQLGGQRDQQDDITVMSTYEPRQFFSAIGATSQASGPSSSTAGNDPQRESYGRSSTKAMPRLDLSGFPLVEVIESVNATERAFIGLAHYAGRLIIAVSEHVQIGEVSGDIRQTMEDFFNELNMVQTIAKKFTSRGIRSRSLSHESDKQAVLMCNGRIFVACHLFEIRSAISICRAVARVEAQLDAQSDQEDDIVVSGRLNPANGTIRGRESGPEQCRQRYLKDAISSALAIAQLNESMDTQKKNFISLVRYTGQIIIAVREHVQIGEVSGDIRQAVDDLFDELNQVQTFVNQSKPQGVGNLFMSEAYRDKVDAIYNGHIHVAFQLFEIRSAINNHQAFTRMKTRLGQ